MNIVLVNDGMSGDMHPFFAFGRELWGRWRGMVIYNDDSYRAQAERLGFRCRR
ncbi:hypothetical protein [Burkholderia sp. TSV86]|uniref:hypothetical protein n=1 Tax=Burkholderia sp. TSV86 TaxID=1385594 RepID=UPI000A5BC122|nr:hypothetical protein [Burkholderia sp. TSV86]